MDSFQEWLLSEYAKARTELTQARERVDRYEGNNPNKHRAALRRSVEQVRDLRRSIENLGLSVPE